MTLSRLGDEWLIRKIADHENEKSQIAAILERVNDARMQFELYTNIRILNTVKSMERAIGVGGPILNLCHAAHLHEAFVH
ncbi:hypothetical protein FA13DRAFT_1748029 [Coprinellus micaceus]|uniref:Uncharacterized protein n=1 Tax=Coprinellus micaceus TaxID=71717 RepID=A0A4Y7RZP1_COPMI|nr:hypothetical protein FA13DRAFT_1748029 [Coprinellus micaceus]